jgi:hypothetical protein
VRLWHLAVLVLAFGVLAAGSCGRVLDIGPFPGHKVFAVGFLAGAIGAGGPLVLLFFRLSHRRERDAWPTPRRAALIAALGVLCAVSSFAGVMTIASHTGSYWLASLAHVLVVVSGVSVAVAFGGAELLVVRAARGWRRDAITR